MTDRWTSQLSAYLDGELGSEDRVALEQHLGTCAECRTALAQLRRVLAWAQAYPGREPERDSWPELAAAIRKSPRAIVDLESRRRARSRNVRFRVPLALAAGIALAAVAAGSWWVARATVPRDPISAAMDVGASEASPTIAVAVFAAHRYGPAIAELEHALLEEQGALDSSTVRVVREKLAIIDRALVEAREALERDPNSDYLADHYTGMMKKKLTLLRVAARGAAARS